MVGGDPCGGHTAGGQHANSDSRNHRMAQPVDRGQGGRPTLRRGEEDHDARTALMGVDNPAIEGLMQRGHRLGSRLDRFGGKCLTECGQEVVVIDRPRHGSTSSDRSRTARSLVSARA